MKKYLVLFVAVVAAAIVVGCSQPEGDTATPATTAGAATPAPAAETAGATGS